MNFLYIKSTPFCHPNSICDKGNGYNHPEIPCAEKPLMESLVINLKTAVSEYIRYCNFLEQIGHIISITITMEALKEVPKR